MGIEISEAIKQLLVIVNKLRSVYPTKRFTLDGRLVGDLGEVIAETAYDIRLFEGQQKYHDAETTDGKQVQIKATMQKDLTFPCYHIPDYYLGIKIHPDGTFTEIFNGPGSIVGEALKHRKPTKTSLHTVSIAALSSLNEKVQPSDRIPKRSNIGIP